jgi:protein-S-isoprenylcysteine O-methyltransferase Ste14
VPTPPRTPPRRLAGSVRETGVDDIWARGGAWVFAQFPLTALALLAARVGPTIPGVVLGPGRWLGLGLFVAGGLLFLAGAFGLGSRLTPFPRPRPDARLVQTGAYSLARHPIYGGGVIALVGWALLNGGLLGLLAAAGMAIFFDAKAGVEERWMMQRFPDYAAYRRRVRKLIPFVY